MIFLLFLLLATQANAQPSGARAMQDDDTANPGFLWVEQGKSLWSDRAAGKSCADCHGDVSALRGVAARYPKYDPQRGRPVSLAQRINLCRTEHQGATALGEDSDEMLALGALVGLQSRGMPVAVDISGPARPAYEAGRALFFRRQGQLNLACANCHDDLAGRHLGGAVIPEGHPNGYPIYRLEWQAMGSLERRLRQCVIGVRAEPWASGSAELAVLEFYLAARSAGLKVETPAVRP